MLTILLAGVIATIVAQTPVHPEPIMEDEHQAMLALVPAAEATHVAQQNGAWSSPATWSAGSVPGANARVHIPLGRAVHYDVASASPLAWVRIEGTLTFATQTDTAMTVDTVVVLPGGVWQQGTAAQPIAASARSTVTFSDGGPVADRLRIGRGFLAHGVTRIHGQPVTPFLKTTGALAAGATQLTLARAPQNWRVGDRIVVTGMAMKAVRQPDGSFKQVSTDEIKTIAAIAGTIVTFAEPLVDERVVEFAEFGAFPYVSNLTRNVRFTSANAGDQSRRGHVMFMHSANVDVRYASFTALGRTRKDIDVTDLDTAHEPTGDNPRGKYAFHFHRAGKTNLAAPPAYAQGNVVENSTSWAYVNHDSHVLFEDNIAHNAFGAAFVTENGAELGAFRRNLASTTTGRGFIKDGVPTHDLARSGTAFWFQGGNVAVEDNVATGASHGYSYFERSYLAHNLHPNQRIPRQHLIQMEAAGGEEYAASANTPIMLFKGNTAVACQVGMFNVDNEINGRYPNESVLEDFMVVNAQFYTGINVQYYRNFTFRNVKVLRDSTRHNSGSSGAYGIVANHLVDHQYPWSTRSADRIDGVIIRGYTNGINNNESDLGDAEGWPQRKSKFEVLSDSLDFDGPGVEFNFDTTFLGEPTVRRYPRAALVPFPTFDPPAGYYTATQSVRISAIPGATIYYVIGGIAENPPLETRLQPGSWLQYAGQPLTISQNQRLIAIAVKDGIKGRPRNGVYRIVPAAGRVAAPTADKPSGTYRQPLTVSLTTATPDAAIRYTIDGSDPRTSASARSLLGGQPLALSHPATVKAFAYKGAMVDSAVVEMTYDVSTAPGTDQLFVPLVLRD